MVAAEAAYPGGVEVIAVRHWSLANTTRIAIEITGEVHYRSDRVQNPDRIFFDFTGARPHIDGQRLFSDEVGDKLLKRIRVAETAPGVTRVVLDLESAAEFTVSRLDNPNRLIIELRPAALSHAPEVLSKALANDLPAGTDVVSAVHREPEPMREPPLRAVDPPPAPLPDPPSLSPEMNRTSSNRLAVKVATAPLVVLPAPPPVSPGAADDLPASTASSLPAHTMAKAAAAHPFSDGERSLTRVLGLKINRVVIDPGHGGADEGTVGRHGLMERNWFSM